MFSHDFHWPAEADELDKSGRASMTFTRSVMERPCRIKFRTRTNRVATKRARIRRRSEARAPLVLPKPGFVARIKNYLLDLDASLDFGAVPRLPAGARGVRALPRLHGPLPYRGMAALAHRRAAVGSGHHGPRRPRADAGARRPGVPRDLRRGLAEEVRARGDLPRPLRQRGRQPRHQAQPFGPAQRVARPPDQGGARHRGPALLRAFRHRRSPARSAPSSPMREPAASSRAAPRSPSSSPRTCS